MQKSALGRISNALVLLGLLVSFFVLIEPAPTDLVMICAIGVSLIAGRWGGRGLSVLAVLGLIYIMANTLASINADMEPGYIAFNIANRVYLLLIAYAVCAYLFKADWVDTSKLIDFAIAGAAICAFIVVFAKFHLLPHSELFFRDASMTRMKGTFKDPNVMGPYVAMGLILAIFKVFYQRSIMYLAAAGIITLAVVLSGSRGALMIAGAEIIVFFGLFSIDRSLNKNPFRNFLLAIGALLVLVGGSWAFLQIGGLKEQFASRLEAHAYDTDRFASQKYLFERGVEAPLGHGAGGAVGAFNGLSPHNVYVKVLYEAGYAGFIAFVGMFVVSAWRCFRAWADTRNSPRVRLLAAAILGTLLGHALNSYFVDSTHWRHLFVLFGFAAAFPVTVGAAQRSFSPVRREVRRAEA